MENWEEEKRRLDGGDRRAPRSEIAAAGRELSEQRRKAAAGARRGHRGGAAPPGHAEGELPRVRAASARAAPAADPRPLQGGTRPLRRRLPSPTRGASTRSSSSSPPTSASRSSACAPSPRGRAFARHARHQGRARRVGPHEHADLRRGGRGHRRRGGALGRRAACASGGDKQVLCVTHLATIAVRADNHLRIEKATAGGPHGDPRGQGDGRRAARGDRPDAGRRPHGRAVPAARAGAARASRPWGGCRRGDGGHRPGRGGTRRGGRTAMKKPSEEARRRYTEYIQEYKTSIEAALERERSARRRSPRRRRGCRPRRSPSRTRTSTWSPTTS